MKHSSKLEAKLQRKEFENSIAGQQIEFGNFEEARKN